MLLLIKSEFFIFWLSGYKILYRERMYREWVPIKAMETTPIYKDT